MARRKPLLEFRGLLSFLILYELKQRRLYGEQLAARIGKRRGATLTPGTIYPALKKLRARKLVKFARDGRKKIYVLTLQGRTELVLQLRLFSRYFDGLKRALRR